MIEIEFHFSDSSNGSNLTKASEIELRYDLFLGGLIFKGEDRSIVMDWGWIPLVDFGLCLIEICKSLSLTENGEAEFEFTESDGKIVFRRINDRIVRIIPSFANEVLESNFDDFQRTIDNFYKKVIFSALARNPELQRNKTFVGYLDQVK